MQLCDLKIGNSAYIKEINLESTSRVRLSELGLIKGTKVTNVLKNNGINAYKFRNTLIAIRNCDASNILIGDVND